MDPTANLREQIELADEILNLSEGQSAPTIR